MAMKQVDPSALSTNSVLDVLNTDHSDEELSAASKSYYDDISEPKCFKFRPQDRQHQENKLEMNRSSGSAYVPM